MERFLCVQNWRIYKDHSDDNNHPNNVYDTATVMQDEYVTTSLKKKKNKENQWKIIKWNMMTSERERERERPRNGRQIEQWITPASNRQSDVVIGGGFISIF